jgi:Tol biopolymer transport system component
MTNSQRLAAAAGLLLACGFLLFFGVLTPGIARLLFAPQTPTPDVVGTFQALISTGSPPAPTSVTPTEPVDTNQPAGHIVLTCQIFKYQSAEQICIMNADGSGYRRLTTEDGVRHYYPSLAPDGQSVVFSQYREDNVYEIYELTLADGKATRLTDRLGVLTGPEISPDGKSIIFMRWTVASNQYQIWLMDRSGGNPRQVFSGTGWDPTWSPDGTRILFASDINGSNQLYIVNLDGTGLKKVSDLPALRGRSDWSPQDLIVTYSGDSWKRELYIMNSDGTNQHQVSPSGGNSQGPSFSPDGQWIAFTAYFDKLNDINGCEIYTIRKDGSDLRQLTNNDYCDYQPRWGP